MARPALAGGERMVGLDFLRHSELFEPIFEYTRTFTTFDRPD
jgi:hypothetical protein